MTTSVQSCAHDSVTATSIEGTLLPRFSSNSEAFASELLETLEEMYMHGDIFCMFQLLITHSCVNRCERVNSE